MTTPMTPPMTDEQRLTDEQLAHVAARLVDDQPKCHVCNGSGMTQRGRWFPNCAVCDGTGFFALGTATMRSIVDELLHLRSRLAAAETVARAAAKFVRESSSDSYIELKAAINTQRKECP